MKLHEAEKYTSDYGDGYRRAVPGGYLYIETQNVGTEHAPVFVPDPTAEHVTHGAGGAAAAAIYRDAVRDCWAIADDAMRYQGAPEHDRATMRKAFDALRFDGSTSQAGEG